jgi:hypothetical protein
VARRVFFHPSLERLYPLGEVAHDARQLASAEEQHDDRQDYEPMKQAKLTHYNLTNFADGPSLVGSLPFDMTITK